MTDIATTRFSQSLAVRCSGRNTAPAPTGCLVRLYPRDGLGQLFDLEGDLLVVGRDAACDIALDDDSVSRRHAQVERDEEGYQATDLDSTNGTYVNNERIDCQRLRSGDRLRFGNQIFRFLAADSIDAEYYETVYKIMTTDGLTQVHNKRYLIEVLERELLRSQRTGRPLSVVMIDVDRFKSINDTHGHLAGDEVLAELCRRIKQLLRRDEVLARYGGEEFTVVLADTPLEEAVEVAQRLRAAIAERPFPTERVTLAVTASLGVAEAASSGSSTAAALLEAADRQLYAAKQEGRNRVVG